MIKVEKKPVYFENLDGLRFLCFLSVFFFHSFHTESDSIKENSIYQFVAYDLFGNGNLGVNFFFVLSGFLITYLLIEEKKSRGIHIGKFWVRRILRIWPLYFACVFFGFVIFPILKSAFGQIPNETASPIYYFFFVNNFEFISKGLPDSSVLGVLWSIAIEEQFYFVWPIILTFIPVRHFWVVFCFIIVSSWIFRGVNDSHMMHEYHSLSCMGDLAIGGFGAWLLRYRRILIGIENLTKWLIILIYFLFVVVFFFRSELLMFNSIVRICERSIVGVIILMIILEQSYAKNSFFKMKNYPRATKLGKITYGLYCLHFVGILITTNLTKLLGFNNHLWQVLLLDTVLALSISVGLAKVSFFYFESPFLKLKERFTLLGK